MEKLIVFDGNSILNRAFYGVRPLSTKEGIPTNAIFGFVNIIRRAMQEAGENLKYAAIAFDRKEPTFRHKACDFYKANRKGMPEELGKLGSSAEHGNFFFAMSLGDTFVTN